MQHWVNGVMQKWSVVSSSIFFLHAYDNFIIFSPDSPLTRPRVASVFDFIFLFLDVLRYCCRCPAHLEGKRDETPVNQFTKLTAEQLATTSGRLWRQVLRVVVIFVLSSCRFPFQQPLSTSLTLLFPGP